MFLMKKKFYSWNCMLYKHFCNQTEHIVHSSEELDTFVLYQNSELLIIHSFITPTNAHLTHKNIVLYYSYMF